MNKAFLLLGTNVGDREKNLVVARQMLDPNSGVITNASSVYETAPWGKSDQPAFLNQAVQLMTPLDSGELMRSILRVEALMGRQRTEKYGPRIIDIDILLFNAEQRDDPFLTIPHPGIPDRRFVLVPLSEIAGEIQHPILKKSITELLEHCTDALEVVKYNGATG